jgi:hypothetical protein
VSDERKDEDQEAIGESVRKDSPEDNETEKIAK